MGLRVRVSDLKKALAPFTSIVKPSSYLPNHHLFLKASEDTLELFAYDLDVYLFTYCCGSLIPQHEDRELRTAIRGKSFINILKFFRDEEGVSLFIDDRNRLVLEGERAKYIFPTSDYDENFPSLEEKVEWIGRVQADEELKKALIFLASTPTYNPYTNPNVWFARKGNLLSTNGIALAVYSGDFPALEGYFPLSSLKVFTKLPLEGEMKVGQTESFGVFQAESWKLLIRKVDASIPDNPNWGKRKPLFKTSLNEFLRELVPFLQPTGTVKVYSSEEGVKIEGEVQIGWEGDMSGSVSKEWEVFEEGEFSFFPRNHRPLLGSFPEREITFFVFDDAPLALLEGERYKLYIAGGVA